MFKAKKNLPPFTLEISQAALELIFDDCDKFDADEKGGRLSGTFQQNGDHYKVCVTGLFTCGAKCRAKCNVLFAGRQLSREAFQGYRRKSPEVDLWEIGTPTMLMGFRR